MIYTVAHIVEDVRVAIDRNRRNSDLLGIDINTQMLDESIVKHIIDGARIVLSNAPLSSLGEGVDFASAVVWGDKCSGRMVLPADFLRLIVFKMSDWAYGVEVLLPSSDMLYKRMRSPIKALRGVSERPYAFDVLTSVGRMLEFYSCDSEEATVESARYVPLPKIEEGEIDFPIKCYRACINEIASLVILERGGTELAQALETEAKSLIE